MKNIRIILLFIAVAAFAVPMVAQSEYQLMRPIEDVDSGGWEGDTSYSQGQYLQNPCTAVDDWVWVNYAAYVAGAQKDAGVDRYLFDESTTVGGGYAASGASQADVAYGASLALRQYHKVNTPDNFHVVTVVNFDPGSKSTWVTVETACGNGMPDSLE
jgi:hypothetical protein